MKVLVLLACLVAAVYCTKDDYTVIDHCYPFVTTVTMYAAEGSKLLKQGANDTWTDVTSSPCVTKDHNDDFVLTCDIDSVVYKVETSDDAKKAAEAKAQALAKLLDDAAEDETETETEEEEDFSAYEDQMGDPYNQMYIVQCSEHCFSNITNNRAVSVEVPTTKDAAHQYYLIFNNQTIATYNVTSGKRDATTASKVAWVGEKLNFKKNKDVGVYYWIAVYKTSVTYYDGTSKAFDIYRVKEIFHLNKGPASREYDCYPNLASHNMVSFCKDDEDTVTATSE